MQLSVRSRPERTRGLPPAILLATGLAWSLVASPSRVAAQGSNIGLYTDASGTTCSFSGNSPGLVTTYVVVRPDVYGISGVRFSAPAPACLGATYVGEVVPPGVLALGSSQTGVSIVLQQCSLLPVNVLQITYQQSGNTTPCCDFSIVPDPALGSLVATGCQYQDVPLTSVVSHFNADATCACVGNSPPNPSTDPVPIDGTIGVSVQSSVSWSAWDHDNNLAEFDVYLGTTASPPLVAAGLTVTSYTPASLAPLTQHYWRVVARDALGLETSGAIWTFTTRDTNSPPHPPLLFAPTNGAQGVALDAFLRWFGDDIDGDPLVYDVYFGDANPPPLVAADFADTRYTPASMAFATTYYWRIVARDPLGHETSSPTSSFVTRPTNYPPNTPTLVSPGNGAQAQPLATTLSWTATDVDPGPLVSDVYFGIANPPPLVASNLATPTYAPAGLVFSTQYYWRVVVRDQHGAETSGPVWTFTTRPENFPPNVPSSESPRSGATNQPESSTLAWQSGDLDGHAVTFDVYFGTANPPPLVATNVATSAYAPGPLAFGTTYRWKIVARDQLGAETAGPVWLFTTRVNSPPSVPSNPSPSNGLTNRPLNQTLAWQCTDPEGHALTFDVYFGTSTPPPLVASNVATKLYAPGVLAFSTTYRWQIIARDAFGLERTGPTWSFTTKANSPPFAPSNPSPGNHGATNQTPVLTWNATDVDLQPLTFDVYLGTSATPPLVAGGLTEPRYEPGTLALGRYYWRVVSSDGLASTSGPTWDFVNTQMGDANVDGVLTLADATCALGMYAGFGPCQGFSGNPLADVECSGAVTPRDARCIHKHVLDGSCDFCSGTMQAEAAVNTPIVSVSSMTEWNDTLYVRLSVSGVPSLESFGFIVQSHADYVRTVRRGVTTDFVELRTGGYPSFSFIGAYSLTGADANATVEFIELRFYAAYWYDRTAYIWNFVDDLVGAGPLSLYLGGGGVPVLITRFEAVATEQGVDVRWELESDEAMESFTLYRRENGAALPIVIAQGAATARSYLDTSVEAGKTYHYELLIRTTDGDEFRSPIATVSTHARALALGQNHPNPFNPQTVIPYELPVAAKPERVRLWILDISGRIVATLVNEDQAGGSYRVQWLGKDDRGEAVSSGVYFYVLDAAGERRTRKLVLLK